MSGLFSKLFCVFLWTDDEKEAITKSNKHYLQPCFQLPTDLEGNTFCVGRKKGF